MEPSGVNLLNFMNSATSSVQTVLSKPSCFKRNTNHRRFLQKQLLQYHIDSKDSTSLSKLIPASITQKPKHRTIKKTKSITLKHKQRGWKFSNQPRVPSPTMDYLQFIELENASFYSEPSLFETKIQGSEEIYFERNSQIQNENYDNPFDGFFFPDVNNSFKQESASPSHSTSSFCSSYSPECEDAHLSENDMEYTEFLTGEELVMTLKESELFVPENCYVEDEFCFNINTDNYYSPFLYDGYNISPISEICISPFPSKDCYTPSISDKLLNSPFEFDFL